MELVKALLVFFVLTGCAEVASELPLSRAATRAAAEPAAHVSDAARLGPPSPRGTSARHVDQAAATSTAKLY
jgi:hypothetical protein